MWEEKAYAKINLVLDVACKRPDGYHEVSMIMQSIGLCDTLLFEKKEEKGTELIIEYLGQTSEDLSEDNLICKAYDLMEKEYNLSGGLKVILKKHIPIAAGMAGGSTDAAAALRAVNKIWELGLSSAELEKKGLKLGADVPFCIEGGTRTAKGIGEILEDLTPMPDCHILVAKPDINVSTAWAYGAIDSALDIIHPDTEKAAKALENHSLKQIADNLGNSFESVTAIKYPVISEIKEIMITNGALNALMSGSGPSVFGLYDNREKAEKAKAVLEEKNICQFAEITYPKGKLLL